MTREDFIKIAAALHRSKPAKDEYQYASKYTQWAIDCRVVGMACAETNSSFNMERFMEACKNG